MVELEYIVPLLSGVLGGVLGGSLLVMIKPWIEQNFVYKYLLEPIKIYPKIDASKGVVYRLDTKKKTAYHVTENFVLTNKSNETIVVSDIGFSFKDGKIDKGDVAWVNCITDDKNKLGDYIKVAKNCIIRNISIPDKGEGVPYGGTTENLLPAVLEPNKAVKIYTYIEPVIRTRSTPNKISVNVKLSFQTSKKDITLNLGNIEWKQIS